MRINCFRNLRTATLIGLVLSATFLATTAVNAQGGLDPKSEPYMIYEDWEMAINDPAVATYSPQITFFTCPDATDEDCYFQLQMNYHAHHEFSGGGFHVGAFHNSVQLDEARSEMRIPFRVDGDRIRWTSIMACIDKKLLFAVNNGQGDDWGNFGGPQYLVAMDTDHHADLSKYRPQNSLDMVDIGFGSNRVSSIRLRRVRYFYKDGTAKTVQIQTAAE